MDQSLPLFVNFCHLSTNLTVNYKSIDVVLGTQTLGGRIEYADKPFELWWLPKEI